MMKLSTLKTSMKVEIMTSNSRENRIMGLGILDIDETTSNLILKKFLVSGQQLHMPISHYLSAYHPQIMIVIIVSDKIRNVVIYD
jgi:hypothetical protein